MADKTPQPVLIMNSVLAGITVISGGAALADFVDKKTLGLLLLIYSGIQVMWSTYTAKRVTPNSEVPAVPAVDPDTGAKIFVASDGAKNIPNGTPVDVTITGPAPWEPPEPL